MHIIFNHQTMHVQVVVGTLEEYKPTEQVKEINDKVNTLREKMEKFMQETVRPEMQAIQTLVDEENKKHIAESKEDESDEEIDKQK